MRLSHFSGFVVASCVTAGLLLCSTEAFAAQACLPSGANSAHGSGVIGGGHVGYNWQQGTWIYGLETDFSGSGLQSSMSGGLIVPCFPDTASTSAKLDWYGTMRGRVGWAAERFLVYGTGGFAYGDVKLDSSYTGNGTSTAASTSQVKGGFAVGAGVDYMLQPNLVLNFGYQYVDLGTLSVTSSVGATSQTASTHAAFHVLMAGLTWRFSPGGGSLPGSWQGFYAGGHAGGAWGLNTDATYSTVFLSDIRLKRDIALVGSLDNGLGLYRYRYLWDDTVYVGVMAQEVALLRPDAVVHDGLDNYLRVNYASLGLHLMTLSEWKARGERL